MYKTKTRRDENQHEINKGNKDDKPDYLIMKKKQKWRKSQPQKSAKNNTAQTNKEIDNEKKKKLWYKGPLHLPSIDVDVTRIENHQWIFGMIVTQYLWAREFTKDWTEHLWIHYVMS